MVKFVNVKLLENTLLDPMLEELVDKLALKYPEYTFGCKGLRPDEMYPHRMAHKTRVAAPDGYSFVRKINVHCGSELLGYIDLDNMYRRYKAESVYTLVSWRIDKGRKGNKTQTTKLASAMREFKHSFIPQNLTELIEKADNLAYAERGRVLRDLIRPISSGVSAPSSLDMQTYIYSTLTGKENDKLYAGIRSTFLSDKYHKVMAEYLLGTHMDSKKSHTVLAHNGAFVMRDADNEHLIPRIYAFEELPPDVQDKVAVLKLMEDSEVVLDVGIRINSDLFCIVR